MVEEKKDSDHLDASLKRHAKDVKDMNAYMDGNDKESPIRHSQQGVHRGAHVPADSQVQAAAAAQHFPEMCIRDRSTAALIAGFIPAASPPDVIMAIPLISNKVNLSGGKCYRCLLYTSRCV